MHDIYVYLDLTVGLCADGKGLGNRSAGRRSYLEERRVRSRHMGGLVPENRCSEVQGRGIRRACEGLERRNEITSDMWECQVPGCLVLVWGWG